MLKAEVEIGGRYTIRIGGRFTTVRVTGTQPGSSITRPRFLGTNEATGKTVRFTAAKLRGRARAKGEDEDAREAQPDHDTRDRD